MKTASAGASQKIFEGTLHNYLGFIGLWAAKKAAYETAGTMEDGETEILYAFPS